MAKKDSTIHGKGLRLRWYEPTPDVFGSGGLGVHFAREKKSRSFFVMLPPDEVAVLYAFLGERLKELKKKEGKDHG